MDAKTRTHKKHATTFDYEKEMEEALSAIFRNLRGIEETRFRVMSSVNQTKSRSASLPTTYCIDLPQNPQDPEFQEKVHTEQDKNVIKSKRKLPDVPKGKKSASVSW